MYARWVKTMNEQKVNESQLHNVRMYMCCRTLLHSPVEGAKSSFDGNSLR
jgi:hypothetical protein